MIWAIPVWSIIWNLGEGRCICVFVKEYLVWCTKVMKQFFCVFDEPVRCQIAIWRIWFVANQVLEESEAEVFIFELVKFFF